MALLRNYIKKGRIISFMHKLITIIFITCGLTACHRAPQEMICGVPVKGTPWELVASVADHGDGSFIPECVSLDLKNKTYVDGWVILGAEHQYPAKMIIEKDSTGQATHACVYCPLLDRNE